MMIFGSMITNEICFSLEDGEPIEGEAFFDEKSIGETMSDGCVMASKSEYKEGELIFRTTHNERVVDLFFNIKR